MAVSKARTAGTMLVLVVVLVLMLVIGLHAARRPFPSLSGKGATTKCDAVKVRSTIFRKEITVSVYNGSSRSGLADRTMAEMEKRSFTPGTVGNVPKGSVAYAEVRSTTKNDPAAQLVANQFKPPAKVVLAEDNLGPGVDVVLGPKFTKLHVPSPKSLKLVTPRRTCLGTASPTPTPKP
ncbi:MAG: LytR C-terminal domain-containing protein [Marmoricola sp.]